MFVAQCTYVRFSIHVRSFLNTRTFKARCTYVRCPIHVHALIITYSNVVHWLFSVALDVQRKVCVLEYFSSVCDENERTGRVGL